MSKSTSSYPALSVGAAGTGLVSHAGAVLLLRTAEKTGLTNALSEGLSPWRKPLAQFDPGKIVLDLRCRWLSAGTVSPTWRACVNTPVCSVVPLPIRPCPA